MILSFIILVRAIIKFIQAKNKIKTTLTDSEEKRQATKKAIIILINWIILSGILWYIIPRTLVIKDRISNSSTDKPIIYLYPKASQEISVKLGYKDKITVSYPKYKTNWNILATKTGDLTDLNTNKKLYSLYYESKAVYNFKVEKDGFIVKGEDVAEFLEDKLSILGLTDREKEEFIIIYWLPILQKNKYNYIRFATKEEINANMPLEINPTPDTSIRILMTFKKLKYPINIKEQQLTSVTRKGFVAVEWGGTEIK